MNIGHAIVAAPHDRPVPSVGRCLHCNKALQPGKGRGRQKSYCDARCKNRAQNEHRKSVKRAEPESSPRLLPDGKLRRTCLCCGRMFVALDKEHMYCSKSCGLLWRRMTVDNCTCTYCGKTYDPKRSNRTTYCCRECAFADKNRLAVDQELARLRQVRIVVQFVCLGCGAPITRRRRRCDECDAELAREKSYQLSASKKDVRTIPCAECGKPFENVYGVKNRVYCSSECMRRRNQRIAKARRRARQRGLPHDSIDPIAVFERDGWRCHICGGLTVLELRGSIEPDAPELDHVVALANGGSHTWGNVACAHRRCNQDKGAAQ